MTPRLARSNDDILPGLPDALPTKPPKAEEYEGLTLDQAIARAHEILDRVQAGVTVPGKNGQRPLDPPEATYLLFSGGGDSSVLAHLMRQRVNGVVHVRTGISIQATWTYVQDVCAKWGIPLHEACPDDTYEDIVLGRVGVKTDRGTRPKGTPLWSGFPGPAAHYFMYQRLKERALDKFRASVVGRRGRSGQIVFIAGMRWAESDRRFRNASEWDHWGSVIWCSPIVWWTAGHLAEYRARYLCNEPHEHAEHRLCQPDSLPLSEVTANIHMSGDCLCGAFAKPGELDGIEFFYPEEAGKIRALENAARDAGISRCVWGAGKQPAEAASATGRLCSKCVPELDGQMDILDEWLAAGLIDTRQHATLKSSGV